MQTIFERVRRSPKRVVFAEGEEEQVIRAALAFVNQGLGRGDPGGREDRVLHTAAQAGLELATASKCITPNCRRATPFMRNFCLNVCSAGVFCCAIVSA